MPTAGCERGNKGNNGAATVLGANNDTRTRRKAPVTGWKLQSSSEAIGGVIPRSTDFANLSKSFSVRKQLWKTDSLAYVSTTFSATAEITPASNKVAFHVFSIAHIQKRKTHKDEGTQSQQCTVANLAVTGRLASSNFSPGPKGISASNEPSLTRQSHGTVN